jgi:hypothetical protein
VEPISEFAADSPLEGAGFEPSVPVRGGIMFGPSVCRIVIRKDRTFCRFPRKNPYGARRKRPLLYGGTEGSNLLSSSGESANHRFRDDFRGSTPRYPAPDVAADLIQLRCLLVDIDIKFDAEQ